MPRFTIIPTYDPSEAFDLIAPDTAEMLNQISERGWQAADVYEDQGYQFTVRMAEQGFWTIFQRDSDRSEPSNASADLPC